MMLFIGYSLLACVCLWMLNAIIQSIKENKALKKEILIRGKNYDNLFQANLDTLHGEREKIESIIKKGTPKTTSTQLLMYEGYGIVNSHNNLWVIPSVESRFMYEYHYDVIFHEGKLGSRIALIKPYMNDKNIDILGFISLDKPHQVHVNKETCTHGSHQYLMPFALVTFPPFKK